eukprot:GHVN01105901.1.p2 GENE.GHVN01105901.1~~GHVN01105901.1.p2  ORF type:complete len:340 (+),score=47.39 GHVN01105901.1:2064-3083(+)
MVSVITRNITSQFVRLRAEHRNKKHRFGYSILGNGATGASGVGGTNHPLHSGSGDNTGQQRLLTGTDESVATPTSVEVEMTAQLPPVWVDRVGEAQDDIVKIKEKMSTLQKAEQRRLLKVFASGDDGSSISLEQDIDNLTQTITQLFHHCETHIHQIQSNPSNQGNFGVSASEYTLRKNAQRSIATQLQDLSQQFRNQQKHYLSELRKRKAGSSYAFEEQRPARGEGFDAGFDDRMAMELESMDQDIDQRNDEIGKIAKSVAELHNVFKELSVLVIDQGTVLDRIDYNVEQVVSQTQQASVHIAKAEQYQKSARAGAVTGCLVIAIVVLLILWIVKHAI